MSYRLFDSHFRKASQTDSGIAFGTLSGANRVVMDSSKPFPCGGGMVVGLPTATCPDVVGIDVVGIDPTTSGGIAVVVGFGVFFLFGFRVVVDRLVFEASGGPGGTEICNKVVAGPVEVAWPVPPIAVVGIPRSPLVASGVCPTAVGD
jgi:hypothetical protein